MSRVFAGAASFRLRQGVPHFLLNFPGTIGILVEDEKNFATAVDGGLAVGRLHDLMLETPLVSLIAGDLNLLEIDFLGGDLVTRHLGNDLLDKLGDRLLPHQRGPLR